MSQKSSIRLSALAEAVRLEPRTVQRWLHEGLIRGTNLGRGRFLGVRLSHDEALELLAVALLRRNGLPLSQVRIALRELRAQGKIGAGVFAAGRLGRRVLLDGAGDAAPLRELSGQGLLWVSFDLRTLRAQAERLVDTLKREEQERVSAREARLAPD
jgi:DNA-binding transcriptional MerR regulator